MLRTTINNNNNGNGNNNGITIECNARDGEQRVTSNSYTTVDRNAPQFWAKGTGFGSGTTQQHWNIDVHMLKRKHDEDTVTCIIKVCLIVATSFVYCRY